jgi:hypothetical protein
MKGKPTPGSYSISAEDIAAESERVGGKIYPGNSAVGEILAVGRLADHPRAARLRSHLWEIATLPLRAPTAYL